MRRGILIGSGTVIAAVAVAALWLAWPDLLEPAEIDETSIRATPDLVVRGEYLARAGNCIGCHTRRGGEPYAGGRAVRTPFGDVFSSNLTPDEETGIGTWTSADFWRAMHHGRSKDGRRLYPAFPYTSYTYVTREDSDAIFAYLMSLEPVRSPRIEPSLRFPYNLPLALAVWRALYFRPAQFEPDPERDAEWNRGAYLVEGLAHCKACHSPRGRLGAVDPDEAYAGGQIPGVGWDAPPLNPRGKMSDDEATDLAMLLATGVSKRTAVTGPMAEVVFHSLQHLTKRDIDAIVAYVRTLPARSAPPARAPVLAPGRMQNQMLAGARLYAEHCAECHGNDGEGKDYKYPPLAGNALVTSPSPTNAIRNVLLGGYPPSTAGNPRPYGMPPFAHQLSAAEAAAVLTYVRNAWGNAAGPVTPDQVDRRSD